MSTTYQLFILVDQKHLRDVFFRFSKTSFPNTIKHENSTLPNFARIRYFHIISIFMKANIRPLGTYQKAF